MKQGSTSIHFTADDEKKLMLLRPLLYCNQLCVFLAVARMLDEQRGEHSSTEAADDFSASEMEALRRPPEAPPAENAGERSCAD